MESEKSRSYKLIRKKHIIPSIFALLLSFTLVVVAVALILEVVVFFLCEAKFESEYKVVNYMARLYEAASDKEEARILLEKEGRDFYITDKEGNILYSKGEITSTSFGGMVTNSGISESVQIYYDKNCDCLELKSDGELDIVLTDTYKLVKKHGILSSFFSSDDSEKYVTVPLNFWISLD